MFNKREGGEDLVIFSGSSNTNVSVQVVGGVSSNNAAIKPVARGLAIPAFSQRDRSQYNDDAEFRTWSPSSCSATATAAVLNGYGKSVRTTDILGIMRSNNAISAAAGLLDAGIFNKIATQFDLKALINRDGNVDAHVDNLLNYVKQGTPVMANILDPTFFPGGHYVVLVRLNDDNTIAVVNPDPAVGKTVSQNWPLEAFKTYFGRTHLSVVFLPR